MKKKKRRTIAQRIYDLEVRADEFTADFMDIEQTHVRLDEQDIRINAIKSIIDELRGMQSRFTKHGKQKKVMPKVRRTDTENLLAEIKAQWKKKDAHS